MEFSIHNLQKYKLAVHIVQLAMAVVIWVLDIIVMRSTATVDGRLGWNFGYVCIFLFRRCDDGLVLITNPIDILGSTRSYLSYHDRAIPQDEKIRKPVCAVGD